MDRNRWWILGTVLLIGIVGGMGWLLGISPKLDETRAASMEQVAVEAENASYEIQLASLKKQFEGIDNLRADLAALRQAVPSQADIPVFIGQLDSIAQQDQVTLTAISVSDAQPYLPEVADPAVVAPPSTNGSADRSEPTPSPTGPGETTLSGAAQRDLVTAEKFVAIPISLTVDGSYGNVLDFIEGLQKGDRLVMVTTFDVTAAAAETPDSVTATIAAFIYVLLDPIAVDAPTG